MFLPALFLACEPEPAAVETTPSLGEAEHVVVLVLDGVRIEESFGSGTSNAAGGVSTAELLPRIRDELVPEGTLVLPAYNLGTTITAPGHAVLLTGAPSGYGNFPPTESSGAYFPALPTLFELVRSQYEAGPDHVALLGNTTLIGGLGRSTYPGLGADYGTEYRMAPSEGNAVADADVVAEVKSLLASSPSRLVVANLHHPDQMGHYGELASDYASAVRDLDDPVADLWAWIQSQERLRDTTTLVLVGDHGRHRLGYDEDYRQHGDSCAGCREVPMLLLGAGVPRGVVIEGGAVLEDLSATVAWLLGVDSPFATGRVIGVEGAGPAGIVAPVASSDWVVAQAFSTGNTRSEVVAGTLDDLDQLLSTPGALAAEAPQLATRDGLSAACWRELPAFDADTMPWLTRCSLDQGSGWEALPAPLLAVNPSFEPALVLSPAGEPWLAVADNLGGAVDGAAEDRAVRLLTFDGDGWAGASDGLLDVVYPSTPVLAVDGDDAIVGFVASAEVSTGRENRHVELYRVATASQTWTPIFSSLGVTERARQDLPVLGIQNGVMTLAFLDIDEGETALLVTASTDGGATWSPPGRLDSGGRVFSHVSPRLWDGGVAWLQQGDDEAEYCWDGGPQTCIGLGATEVAGLARHGERVVVSVRVDGEWVLREVGG